MLSCKLQEISSLEMPWRVNPKFTPKKGKTPNFHSVRATQFKIMQV